MFGGIVWLGRVKRHRGDLDSKDQCQSDVEEGGLRWMRKQKGLVRVGLIVVRQSRK